MPDSTDAVAAAHTPGQLDAMKEAADLHIMFAPTPRGEAWLKAARAALSKASGGSNG